MESGEPIETAATVATGAEATASSAACCAAMDSGSQEACALCQASTCGNCRSVINGRSVCATCCQRLVAELEAERAGTAQLVPAAIGGVVGASVAGAAWALIGAATNMEIGYVAVGVGYAAGFGVVKGAGGKKGPSLQWVAIACALLGLVLGKFWHFAYAVNADGGNDIDVGYFDPLLFRFFVENLGELLEVYDALWALLALGIAWKLPRPTSIAATS